jgi:hypothetical protein
VSLTDESRGWKNKELGATNISYNIVGPCDGVLIPIVVDPIKKRSPEGFFLFSIRRKIRRKKEMNLERAKRANCVNKLMGLGFIRQNPG